MLQYGDIVTAYLLHKSMEHPGGQTVDEIALHKRRSLPSCLRQQYALCVVFVNEKQR